MENKKIRYDDLRLEVADNGFILNYVEIKKKDTVNPQIGPYENESRDYKKEVFQWTQGTVALTRMSELAKAMNPNAAEALKEVPEG